VAALPGDPAAYELAFLEGRRALEEQGDTLKDARDRAGTVVSAAAVVAGLGGALAFNNADRLGRLTAWGDAAAVVAAIAFAGITFAAAMIWRPFAGGFSLDAQVLVGDYAEGDPPASLAEIHRELAVPMGRNSERNLGELERRLWWFNIALFAFVVEVGALMLVLLDVA
jgi:hypothetical protein